MDNDTLVYFGDAIKDLGNGKVGGYLVRFTDYKTPDLEGDYFDSTTDFAIESGDPLPVYYNHGMDGTLKNKRIGRGETKIDDIGVWIEVQLDMHNEYVQMLYERGIGEGKMGWSSGAVGHLVDRERTGKTWHITAWPLGEGSITPTPAEPKNIAVPLKSLTIPESVEPETAPEGGNAGGVETKTAQVKARAYLYLSGED